MLNHFRTVDNTNNELSLVFIKGILQYVTSEIQEDQNYYDAKYLISDGVKYNLECANNIAKIAVPTFGKTNFMEGFGVAGSLDYVMRMKAGNLRDKGLKDLSIICLRKANELMMNSYIQWQDKDYLRIVKWLIEDGEFAEAEKEENFLRNKLPNVFNREIIDSHLLDNTLKLCEEFKTDLIEASYHCSCSSEQAMYRGRIYSITGYDKRFPRVTNDILRCGLSFYPFIYNISCPNHCEKGMEIEHSNRPFIDDRTLEEICNYAQYLKDIDNEKQKEMDRIEYYKILYQMPEICPKTFGVYRRMKNNRTNAYLEIVKKAKETGINIL